MHPMDRNQPLELGVHAIPTTNLKKAWEDFIYFLPDLQKSKMTTAQTLPRIHALLIGQIPPLQIDENLMTEMVTNLVCVDRDVPLADPRIVPAVQRAIREAIAERGVMGVLGGQIESAKFNVNTELEIGLRSYGIRQIESGRPETIYAPVATPIYTPQGVRVYLGLTRGLADVYQVLCRTYDEAMRQRTLPGERIKAMAFFQGYGASALHPFVDANGRAFMGQFVHDINKLGVTTSEIPHLGELHEDQANNMFSSFGKIFLERFLRTNKIPLLTQEEARYVITTPNERSEYMRQLRDVLMRGIALGPYNQEPEIDQILNGGVELINIWLSKIGFLPSDIFENMRRRFKPVAQ